MISEIYEQTAPSPHAPKDPQPAINQVSLLALFATFFRLGATTFGGMWAATQKLESQLVHRNGWLTSEELQSLLVAATLIPAPKFIGLGGLIGFRMRGWLGSAVSVFSLIAPGALLVLLGVMLISPALLAGPLAPLQRAVGIAVVGLLFGNAYHQLKGAKVKGRKRAIGIGLGLLVALAAVAGVPLLLAAAAGFAAGAVLIRENKEDKQHG
jgi:chromate transporter